jgi:hypothetical protein
MQDSKHKDVDGNPLRYIDVLNAIHDSISDSVKLASGGEHSDLMAFAAHSAITKDPKAIRALYTETLGRKVYGDVVLSNSMSIPTESPVAEYSVDEKDFEDQQISSADTSIRQVPALFKSPVFEPNGDNLDLGGGKFDIGTQYMKDTYGIDSYVHDIFNRSKKHNSDVEKRFVKNPPKTVTIANVLNVIQSQEHRIKLLKQAYSFVEEGGKVYISIYDGDRTGNPKQTSKGWQNNSPASSYMDEVRSVFPNAVLKKGVIIATKPVDPKAIRALYTETLGRKVYGDVVLSNSMSIPTESPVAEYSVDEKDFEDQQISSADTSIRQVPALFKSPVFEPNGDNLDLGGGKFDIGTQYMKDTYGIDSYVHDIFNRSKKHNSDVEKRFVKNPPKTVTIANVLNVIQSQEHRIKLLKQAYSFVEEGGKVYISIYDGDRTGNPKQTSKGWQNNSPASSYMDEVRSVFPNAVLKKGVIIATKPVDHKATLAPIEDMKTGIVALDKRVQALYAETKSPYGDLKKNEVTNGMGRVQYASGGGTPLYSLRPIRDVDVSDTGEPEVASKNNPVVVVDDAGTEVTVTEESKIGKVLDFLDKNPVTKTFDVLNALGRFTMAGDWSAPLVQNWQLANPIESPGLFFKSLLFGPKSLAPNLAIDTGKGGINKNAFFGRKQVHAMGDEIRSHRFYELAKEMKLSMATAEYDRILAEKRAEREEKLAEMRERDPDATLPEIDIMDIDELDVDPDMMGLLSAERHVPGKAASERAMTMMKDFVKFNKFTQALETYEQLGYDPSSEGFKEMASDMAAVLNVMNGDVRFTKNEYDKSIGRLMRRVMFAPRWLTSRVLTNPLLRAALEKGEPGRKWLEANNLPVGRTINPYVLRANIRMVLKAQALWYALLAYFGLMRPFDQFQVKTSVDHMFTRIQVGNYVFKAPGGSMMLLEIADGFYGEDYKNLPPDEARKRFAERIETLTMGRLVNSPGIGIIKEMITGRDFMGKPVGYVDPDLEAYWQKIIKPTMAEVGVPVPDMKLSKLITKNIQYLWLQSYLETFKLADDREEDDKMFEAAFVGGMSALGGRIRYSPPAGKGAYDYDTYGNPPGWQYYLLGANREEWLMNPASDLTQEQLDAMEKDVVE